jgi:hypothetical protein
MATLHGPVVRYHSGNEIDSDSCLDWHAQLLMSAEETDDIHDAEICVGVCQFLTVQLGEGSFSSAELDDYSQEASMFCPVFDNGAVAAEVDNQFREPINDALLVLSAMVLDPLHGHDLGVWMVAELIHRMLPGHNGLVLLERSPLPEPAEPMQHLEAVEKLSRHWQTKLGVVPIDQHPGILGQSTAYVHLPRARAALRRPDSIVVPVEHLAHCPELPLSH